MDRKTFIQTFGLGFAAATVAPKIFFRNEDIILGRYGARPQYMKGNFHKKGFVLIDERKAIMNSMNKQLEGTGVHFGRFMRAPANVVYYKETTSHNWESKPIVAKTMKFRMKLLKTQIKEKNGMAVFEDNKLAPMVYEYLAEDLNTEKHCINAFYDMWVTENNEKTISKVNDTLTIWIRYAKVKFNKPMVYADDEQTQRLIQKL